MSMFRLLIAGLIHYRRLHLAVALGVAAATAVLAGALVVGDSMRGSLRSLALDRLERIDEVLVVPRFFRAHLANELQASPAFTQHFSAAVPVALLAGTVEEPATHRRATNVNILGIGARFAELSTTHSAALSDLRPGEACLNEALADELGVGVGQDCVIRLPIAREVPPDSALGRKTETVTNLRLRVKRIIPATGLGRFALRPNQSVPRDAFVCLDDVQRVLKQSDKVNAILVGAGEHSSQLPEQLAENHQILQDLLRPQLEADYGLTIRAAPLGYFLLESDRMLLEPAVVREAERTLKPLGAQAVFTYLANTLADGEREIPYSTVAAIDFDNATPTDGFKSTDGQPVSALASDEIALNSWAAKDLDAKPGDTIRLTYFEPESTHGRVRENTVDLRLAAVVELSGAAADPNLTPTLPGVTDQLSIADWNPPFPFDSRRVRPRDEEYWDNYKATPKAFVSLATGQKLWGSRFGNTTSLRVPGGENVTVAGLSDRLKLDPRDLGFAFRPIRQLAIEASTGTTPFEYLFLGFSFFIITAALVLVAILFRLGVDERAAEVGLFFALGWRLRRVRRELMAEAALVAFAGAILGAAMGIGYAWIMILGLRTWWLAAIRTPFLQLHVTPSTLLIGSLTGVLISLVVIFWSLRRLGRSNVRALLSHRLDESNNASARSQRRARWFAISAFALALVSGLYGSQLGEMPQALAFFGSGALLLLALLTGVRLQLRSSSMLPLVNAGRGGLAWLAFRNAARNPSRSVLTVGLIASASFLIVAISAFRLAPTSGFNSGSGGFALVAESDQPIFQQIDSEDGQVELGFASDSRRALGDAHIFALRVAGGDDASCLNLYQAEQPRVLGLPESFLERGGFAWSQSRADTDQVRNNPWLFLDQPVPDDALGQGIVPVILDEATALYSLHLGGVGSRYEITDGRGERLQTEVVGLLAGSVLQGAVLMNERNFLRYFPDAAGYRFFLIDTPSQHAAAVQAVLEKSLGDFGFDAEPAADRLAEFYAVQNTYLSTFQSLGGLGLLLGTLGLAAVQLRNVVERRAELALLQATGFRRAVLARIVLWENALLLAGGLGIGTCAALVAIMPQLIAGGAHLPWAGVAITLLLVLCVGLAVGLVAVRAALRAPVLATLRGD